MHSVLNGRHDNSNHTELQGERTKNGRVIMHVEAPSENRTRFCICPAYSFHYKKTYSSRSKIDKSEEKEVQEV